MRELEEDHREVDHLLRLLMTALDDSDVVAALQRLDLFWARLAMHIRAEHLHLFPAVLGAVSQRTDNEAPSLTQAQEAIAQLRLDHDFFMHELASAIQSIRELSRANRSVAGAELHQVRATIVEVETRLARHNEAEENGIYLWARTFLNERDQAELARGVQKELTNLPPRFATNVT